MGKRGDTRLYFVGYLGLVISSILVGIVFAISETIGWILLIIIGVWFYWNVR